MLNFCIFLSLFLFLSLCSLGEKGKLGSMSCTNAMCIHLWEAYLFVEVFVTDFLYVWCRYLKRGVNEKGCVANDVETEQIVFEDVPEGCPMQISSIVQNRGSIPLFWSQETSRLNMKPDIVCKHKEHWDCLS